MDCSLPEKKKRVLIICRSDLSQTPRLQTELDALLGSFEITVAGLKRGKEGYCFFKLKSPISLLHVSKPFYLNWNFIFRLPLSLIVRLLLLPEQLINRAMAWYDSTVLRKRRFDLVITHHFSDLKLGVQVSKRWGAKLIFNAHEYYPLEFDSSSNWMKNNFEDLMNIGRKYLPDVDLCFCVGNQIALKYLAEFKLPCEVITNSKPFRALYPTELTKNKAIRIVHHGASIRSRRFELMIEVMYYLGDGFTLDFILNDLDVNYLNDLRKMCETMNNIRFQPPVPFEEIPIVLNKYDIGMYLLPPENYNDRFALPNKFFEFIQGRLCLAIAPSPEMADIVKKHELGIVAPDFRPESLANELKKLSPEKIMHYKNQVHKHAFYFSSENNVELILKAVNRLL